MSNFERDSKIFSELFDFNRTTVANYFDVTNTLKEAAIDVARFHKEGGLIVERDATNLALHNRDLSNAAWLSSATGTKLLNHNGIDGAANSASTISDFDASLIYQVWQDETVVDDDKPNTASFFILKTVNAATFGGVQIQYLGGSAFTNTWTLNTDDGTANKFTGSPATVVVESFGDWWRYSFTVENNDSGNTSLRLRFSPAVNTDASITWVNSTQGFIVVDYCQVETGAFSSSPILTAGTTVLRGRDKIESANTTWARNEEFTILGEVEDFKFIDTLHPYVFQIGSNATTDVLILDASDENLMRLVFRFGTGGLVVSDDIPASGSFKFAVSVSSSRGEVSVSIDGSEDKIIYGLGESLTLSEFFICNNSSLSNVNTANTLLKNIQFFARAMKAEELAARTR